jgi:hypothetical protein
MEHGNLMRCSVCSANRGARRLAYIRRLTVLAPQLWRLGSNITVFTSDTDDEASYLRRCTAVHCALPTPGSAKRHHSRPAGHQSPGSNGEVAAFPCSKPRHTFLVYLKCMYFLDFQLT